MSYIERRARTPVQKAEILDRLESVWNTMPNLRFLQLIINFMGAEDIYWVEDFDFIERLEKEAEICLMRGK